MNKLLLAMTLSAIHLVKTKRDLDGTYYESEDNIELGNKTYFTICDLVGFDINEGSWGDYTIKATCEEIIHYNIEQLLARYQDQLNLKTSKGKIYLAVMEELNFNLDDWTRLENDSELIVKFWDENNISTNAGWDENESKEIGQLNVGEALLNYGDFSHSIIRIK